MTTTNGNHALALLFATVVLPGSLAAQALTIGSEAPRLDIAHWLKGDEVTFSAA